MDEALNKLVNPAGARCATVTVRRLDERCLGRPLPRHPTNFGAVMQDPPLKAPA